MHRFKMPGTGLSAEEQTEALRLQFDSFYNSAALQDILELLKVDHYTLSEVYNGRQGECGRILETQVMGSNDALEPLRSELYPLLKELGFFDICTPLASSHSRIIVLAGSLNACNVRTDYAAGYIGSSTVSVDGLTCYRPVNPSERSVSFYGSSADTEFGVMSEAFMRVFGPAGFSDEFTGDRNLNRISCIRRFNDDAGICARALYAAPSLEPGRRRADTGDTLDFYLERSGVSSDDSLLFITSNRYCNRQFLQLAHQMKISGRYIRFDIIGTTPESEILTADGYDPFQYIQDLIAILDRIRRF